LCAVEESVATYGAPGAAACTSPGS
jgi:hypothetical protein